MDSGLLGEVVSELAIGYLLMIAGAWTTIRQAYKNNDSTLSAHRVAAVPGSAAGSEMGR